MTTKEIQAIVGATVDGIIGPQTIQKIKEYQSNHGLVADGKVGPKTLAVMQGNSPSSSTPATTTTPTPSVSTGSTLPYYGYNRNTALESTALTEEQSATSAFSKSGLISSNTLNKIANDPATLALYVNALTYGGYTIGDILNDMKRKELEDSGNSQASSLKIIDPNLKKSDYLLSASGQQSVSDTAKIIPTFNLQGLMNPDILKYGAEMPDDLFKILVPISDPSSQEFKDAVSKIKSTWFDLTSNQLQASTEQQKAAADYNMQQFKDNLNTKYGIMLSDNATKAWGQIENLEKTYSTNGILGSGLQNEDVDSTLQAIRKTDQRNRQQKLTDSEQEKASYYTSSATASEIAALTPEERQKYGLTPSSDILQKFSISNLSTMYPDKDAQQIQAIHDSIIDENGNYRSTLYKNYYNTLSTDLGTEDTNAKNQVLTAAQNAEQKAYTDYSADTATAGQVAKGVAVDPKAGLTVATPTQPTTPTVQQTVATPSVPINNNPVVSQPKTTVVSTPKTTTSSSAATIAANKKIQTDLNNAGYKGADGKPLTVDGIIGKNTNYALSQQVAAKTKTTSTSGLLSGLTIKPYTTPSNSGLVGGGVNSSSLSNTLSKGLTLGLK